MSPPLLVSKGGGGVGSGLEINFLWYRFGRASLIQRRSSGIILIAQNMLKLPPRYKWNRRKQSFSHDYDYVDLKGPYHYVLKRYDQDINGIEENRKKKKKKRNEGQKRSIPRCFLRLLTERNELEIVQKENVYGKISVKQGVLK